MTKAVWAWRSVGGIHVSAFETLLWNSVYDHLERGLPGSQYVSEMESLLMLPKYNVELSFAYQSPALLVLPHQVWRNQLLSFVSKRCVEESVGIHVVLNKGTTLKDSTRTVRLVGRYGCCSLEGPTAVLMSFCVHAFHVYSRGPMQCYREGVSVIAMGPHLNWRFYCSFTAVFFPSLILGVLFVLPFFLLSSLHSNSSFSHPSFLGSLFFASVPCLLPTVFHLTSWILIYIPLSLPPILHFPFLLDLFLTFPFPSIPLFLVSHLPSSYHPFPCNPNTLNLLREIRPNP